jgi:ABC-type Fe3+-hydroxamate transport system substrate-binding protein
MVTTVDTSIVVLKTIEPPDDLASIEAASRRALIAAALGAGLVVSTGTGARGQEASPTAMREIVDKIGSVAVPAHPQRVVVEGNSTLGNMLALGLKPIGASMNPNSLPTFLAEQIDGITDVRGEIGIDIEKALTLNPDLIIALWGSGGSDWNIENVNRYKDALSATFCYEQNYVYEEDLKQNLIDIAYALGVEDRANDVIAAFDRRVAELRQAVLDSGFDDKPVTVVRIFHDGSIFVPISTSESIIFRAIGIPQPEGQQDPKDNFLELSLERLDILNSAYALVIYIDDNAEMTQEEMLSSDLWQSLTPIRENRVIFVSSGVWNSIELPGAMAIMDDIEHLLLPLAQAD